MGAVLESGFSGRNQQFFGLSSSKVIEGTCSVGEALERAGLNWRVNKIPSGYEGDEGRFIPAGAKFWLTQRNDTGSILGHVGAQYTVFDNEQAFAFADELLGFGAEFEAAGAWNNGANVFLVAKLPEGIKVAGEEDMQLYLQLLNTHDGSGSIAWYCTPSRLSCTNMIRMSIQNAVSSAKIRHTASAPERVAVAAETLRLVDTYKEAMEATVTTLQEMEMELEDVENFFKELTAAERVQAKMLETYNTSPNVPRGNAWGAMNAVTETLQWFPGRQTSMDTRYASNLDGPSQRTVERASRLLLRTNR